MPSTRARSQLFQSNYVKIEDMYITKNGTLGDGSTGDVIETDGSGNLRWVAKTQFNLGDLADFNATGDTGQVLTLQSDDTFAMEWYDWSNLTGTPTTLSGYGITDSFDGAYSSLTGAPTTVSSFTNDSGYITGYTVTESDVTTHQAALSITESQISDLQSYLTSVALNDITDVAASASTTGQLLTAQSDGTFAFETLTTDGLSEGSTNQYFTTDRAKAILSGLDRSITPSDNNLYDLGSSTNKWKDFYINTITSGSFSDDGSNVDFTGGVSGISINDLDDINASAATTGQVLTAQSDGTFSFESSNLNPVSVPTSATATGTEGNIAWDNNYFYICVSSNTWRRIALSTW